MQQRPICKKCGVRHKVKRPHAYNVAFAVWYLKEHGRIPGMLDAACDCTRGVKADYQAELERKGYKFATKMVKTHRLYLDR